MTVVQPAVSTDRLFPQSTAIRFNMVSDILKWCEPDIAFGQPAEIGDMVAYSASPQSGFIAEQCFGVNGGSVMA